MDSDTSFRERPPVVMVAISLFAFMAMCFSLVPYALLALNHQFLPSPKYLVEVKYISLISGLVCGLPTAFLFMSDPLNANKNSVTFNMFAPIFGFIMFFVFGNQLVTSLIPIIAATNSQREVDIIYVVSRPESVNSKFCNAPIILDYMPWYNDKLCNFPPSLHQELRPGSEIIVTGRGTSWGLFVESARVAPQAVLP